MLDAMRRPSRVEERQGFPQREEKAGEREERNAGGLVV
jgi:hypothetical protein